MLNDMSYNTIHNQGKIGEILKKALEELYIPQFFDYVRNSRITRGIRNTINYSGWLAEDLAEKLPNGYDRETAAFAVLAASGFEQLIYNTIANIAFNINDLSGVDFFSGENILTLPLCLLLVLRPYHYWRTANKLKRK